MDKRDCLDWNKRRNQLEKELNECKQGASQLSNLYDQLIENASADDEITKIRARSVINNWGQHPDRV